MCISFIITGVFDRNGARLGSEVEGDGVSGVERDGEVGAFGVCWCGVLVVVRLSGR